MAPTPYAELHSHTNFSFLDGASPADDLVERAVELGLTGLAVTDHAGLYGAVRFVSAAEAVGLHPVIGVEIELRDPAVADPDGIVDPGPAAATAGGRRAGRRDRGSRGRATWASPGSSPRALPVRPRPERARLPGHREPVKEDLRGIGERIRGPHLVLLARSAVGWRSLCRLVSRANMAGTKGVPRFTQALLAEHTEGLVALSGCRDGELARRLRVGDRAGARAVAERYARLFGRGEGPATQRLLHRALAPPPRRRRLARRGVGRARRRARPAGRRHQRRPLRPARGPRAGRRPDRDPARPDARDARGPAPARRRVVPEVGRGAGGAAAAAAADATDGARRGRRGSPTSVELAASCSVDLGFEQYRFPGFPVPDGETPFSYLSELCWAGARRRYHPLTSAVVTRLAHELDVIERAGLAEFFLICWDLMRFAKEQGIPAQGRGSATSSIVSYTLGISRVEPIAHNLLFERFINPGRTTYPDVDIDFSSERREEVIQYIYRRYGPDHTGMVCNLVTYRARSAVREVGYALGFPRPLVDRVAKALETYDSVMVRRDLEADGGFAEFFRRVGRTDAGRGPRGRAVPRRTASSTGWASCSSGSRSSARCRPGASRRRRTTRTRHDRSPGSATTRPGRRRRGPDDDPLAPRTAIRGGGTSDDEGGPGDTPGERGLAAGRSRDRATRRSATGSCRRRSWTAGPIDPESGMTEPPPRRTDKLGRPNHWDPPAPRGPTRARRAPIRSVARVEPEPPPQARGGSTVGMSDWERWLEFCARIDGFPRHLSIHSGGMLVTAAPLIDIAPIERATMVDRVVVQFDKRDVETLKLIKLDLLGLGMLAAMDETMQLIEHDCAVCLDLDRLPEDVPEVFEMLQAADTVGVFQVESRAQMQTLPKSRPQNLDDLVVEVAIIRPGPIQGNAVHPFLRRKQGLEPVTYLHPSLEPVLKDSMGVILYQEQVMRVAIEVAGFTPGARATGSGGRWGRGARAARWRSCIAGSSMAASASRA